MLLSKFRISLSKVFLLLLMITILWVLYRLGGIPHKPQHDARTFTIDYANNTFLMDGRPFRFVSGEVHYFRAPRGRWRDLLRKTRAAGLNALSTYVEWSTHERNPGQFDFSGDADIEHFLQLAAREGLYVLLRPGPFICGERDFGGLPPWLWTVGKDMKLRQNDPLYQLYVARWYDVLFGRLRKYMYGNGGPIILVQVENEFGMVPNCDVHHAIWLRDLIKSSIEDSAVLYSIDPPHKRYMKCVVDGVYPTVDFGLSHSTERGFKVQREVAPQGPLVNAEFYTGWLTHWGEKSMQFIPAEEVALSLAGMLDMGANVNIYMFFGGTNFGFSNGANFDKKSGYMPTVTSYDYDSPLDESGNPTEKYFEIRDTLKRYLPESNVPVPSLKLKGDYGTVLLTPIVSVFDDVVKNKPVTSIEPLTFEQLGQSYGFVLYETVVPGMLYCQTCGFGVEEIGDRAQVFVNEKYIATIYRSGSTTAVFNVTVGQKISLFVENMGRINHDRIYDRKGILSSVLLDNDALLDWNMFRFPLDNILYIESLQPTGNVKYPMFFSGLFEIQSEPLDTYLDMRPWSKGVVFVNGQNLGRYWSERGPEYSLFVPAEFLRVGANRITIFEQTRGPDNFGVKFVTKSLNKILIEVEE